VTAITKDPYFTTPPSSARRARAGRFTL